MYAITKDLEWQPGDTIKSRVGITGPHDCTLSFDEIVEQGQEFRMLTDDHDLVYEGRYVETDNSDEFEPLDCFGTPDAGCTMIEYRSDDGWQQL